MAIFTNANQHPDALIKGGPTTIISQGTKITGQINTTCHLHIDGEFEGEIHSKNTVIIGKSGVIKGSVYAQKFVINGKFFGNTESAVVEILPLGCIEGKVITPEFVIERKGIFIGESKIISKDNKQEKSADKGK